MKKFVKFKNPQENPEYLDKYFYDLSKNNINYVNSLNKKELLELFNKNDFNNEEIYNVFPILIHNIEEKQKIKEKEMSEVLKNIKNEISLS